MQISIDAIYRFYLLTWEMLSPGRSELVFLQLSFTYLSMISALSYTEINAVVVGQLGYLINLISLVTPTNYLR